jgi:hypothetical protein
MNSGIFKIIFAAAIVETYFHNTATAFAITKGQIGQPIVHIHTIATATGTMSMTFTTPWSTVFSGTTTSTTHMFQFCPVVPGDEIK